MLKYLTIALLFSGAVFAAAEETLVTTAREESTTPFHEENWGLHAQATVVPQAHPDFSSPYHSPESSLLPNGEFATSVTSTAFFGVQPLSGSQIYVNPEVSAGRGISNSHGLAGFTNGESFRIGDDSKPRFGISRFFLRQTFGLGGEKENTESGPNQIAVRQDVSRLTATVGKFSLNDLFDANAYAHDPRSQFLNWALMDNGAWDYAADSRGYSWGFVLELNQPNWAVRLGSVLVPKSANQLDLDTNIGRAHGDNLEFEYRYGLLGKPGKARLLAYMNHANMGNYRRTINTPAYGMKVENSRSYSTKYGFGLNLEQELTGDLGAFARLGWNDGATETWAFTEIDRALSLGVSLKGSAWGRRPDTLAVAYVLNGLSGDHADYLRAGGNGFMVGDGKINYSLEHIVEVYYSLKVFEQLSISADIQEIFNPGYNRDRGPVTVGAARLHAEI